MSHKMGWIPDKPDQRDHLYAAHWRDLLSLPPIVDLRAQCPGVYNQGELGSCGPNAGAAALQFDMMKQGEQAIMLSRLFLYYNVRQKEGTVSSDSGVSLRDLIKSMSVQGACPESEWPYDISQFTVKPPAQCYQDARLHRSLSYQRVPQALSQLQAVLASGYLIIFGISVYESFESQEVARTGMVPMPAHNESLLGGHAILAVGYHSTEQVLICRNSWGPDWGDAGYFYLPFAYALSSSLSSDFWTIRTVM